MEYKKPAAVILAGAFVVNAFDPRYGLQIFIDLPPMSAAVSAASVGSSLSIGYMTVPFYSTTTDELIEAPLSERDKSAQS
jgi:hypothetical protein